MSDSMVVPGLVFQRRTSATSVEIVIPVLNEERALPGCIAVLNGYLSEWFTSYDWTITIVDNGSTDRTREVAEELAAGSPRIRTLFLDRRGKGFAIRSGWAASSADIVAYMDVDLSTGLDALSPLIAALAGGHSDLAIGSRLAAGSRTMRGTKRELISRCYNTLLRLTNGARFSDAQCGFKAARTSVVQLLLPHVVDDAWFFDTELLLLAEHNGLRVHEVAVDWVEDADSRVKLVKAATGNFGSLARFTLNKASGRARIAGLPLRPALRSIHPDAVLAPARRTIRPRLTVLLATATASSALAAGGYLLRSRAWRRQ
jgi:glycosyltransferase involved in cell wall biosynthesis